MSNKTKPNTAISNTIIAKLYYYKISKKIIKGASFTAAVCGAIYGMYNLSSKSDRVTEAFFSGIAGAVIGGSISGGLAYVILYNLPIILACLSIAAPWGFAGICVYKHKRTK